MRALTIQMSLDTPQTQMDTPEPKQSCSKRAFDGQVKKWRRFLHTWDNHAGAESSGALPTEARLGAQHTALCLCLVDGM